MKYKTTRSQLKRYYGGDIYSIGYCDIQFLTQFKDANSYLSGVYGWNADVYEVEGVALVTGYRPIGQSVDYEITKKYEKKARAIYEGVQWITYDQFKRDQSRAKRKINALLKNYVKEIRGCK